MISKELLSDVLEIHITKIEDIKKISNNKIRVNGINMYEDINIHELAHKCKNCAFDKGFHISENEFCIRIKRLSTGEFKVYEYSEEEQTDGIVFKPKYTFKACEWILDNK